jgi:hypothetical protein
LVLLFEEAVGDWAEAIGLVLVSPVSAIWAGRTDSDFLDLDLDTTVADFDDEATDFFFVA